MFVISLKMCGTETYQIIQLFFTVLVGSTETVTLMKSFYTCKLSSNWLCG